MAESLKGTVALVTGASSGIGAATAQTLAASGATVALLARRADRLRALAQQIRAEGAQALVLEVDITDPGQAEAAVQRTVDELGRLDTVVNNAGVSFIGPVAQASAQEWDRMVAVNIEGVLHMTRAAVPHLIRAAQDSPRRVADVVTISSTAGRVARAGQAVYALTKSGVIAFSEALRQELQPMRVRVGVVEPGTVDTELASHMPDGVREAVARQLEGLELLEAQDIADAVAYMVTRKRRVAVNEMLVRAAEQTW
ncbi:SDR family NAD(P)-dependent oxidoreductase [Phytohabitans flavus]|uniref:Oxidoreductase n=1 Tax=Phytohabitans flavus TaxID=1076124 RepID=A0A6F8XN22_9ACTN|nr:SDR family NAD(P)-dependent oxidoreductase [Phytohabitans flavus]BCB75216.1 oxidoreductase [Phytohabitans flavus]